MDMETRILSACRKLSFPEDITDQYLQLCQKIVSDNKGIFFDKWLDAYQNNKNIAFLTALSQIKSLALNENLDENQLTLFFYLNLVDSLEDYYKKAGFPYEIYMNSIEDLKWKMYFSQKMTGVYGIHTGPWESNFFKMSVFGIGRLEFENVPLNPVLLLQKDFLKNAPDVLRVHIPEAGRLNMDDVHAAYEAAINFFCKYIWKRPLEERPVVFECESWLLYPANRAFLPSESNIVRFMDEYKVISSFHTENELWRVFNRPYNGDPSELPEETALQKGYKQLLLNGKKAGSAYGYFEYKKR